MVTVGQGQGTWMDMVTGPQTPGWSGPLWLGETASAFGGGAADLSDAWVRQEEDWETREEWSSGGWI